MPILATLGSMLASNDQPSAARRPTNHQVGSCAAFPNDLLDTRVRRWWVTQVPGSRLGRYRRHLMDQGIANCHFIEHRYTHRPGKGWRRHQRALLGGYLFAADCHRDDLLPSGLPVTILAVPDADEMTDALRQLKSLLDKPMGQVVINPHLQPGQQVRLVQGTFAGQSGVIRERRGDHELVVELPVLGTRVEVILPASSAESA